MNKILPSNHDRETFPVNLAGWIIRLELLWPFPLLVVGILQILNPLLVTLVIVLALIPWVTRLLFSGRLTRPAFVTGALLLWVASGFISMWVSYDPSLSWPMLLTLLGSISLFFAIANTIISPRRISEGLIIGAGLVAFYFVGQYAYFGYDYEAGWLVHLARTTGSLLPDIAFFGPHPNVMAGFLEGVFLLSLVLTWQARSARRFVWGVCALLIFYGLLISTSWGAWLGLAMAGVIWMLLLVQNRKLRLSLGLVGGGAVIAGLLFTTYAIIEPVSSEQEGALFISTLKNVDGRFITYRNSLYLLGDYLFTGVGLGDVFMPVYSRYQLLLSIPLVTYDNNLFLSVWLGLGISGLSALIWLLISFYYFVFQVERASLGSRSLPLFRAAWLGVTVNFIHGLVDAPQFSEHGWTMPMLFAVLGVAIATGRSALLPAPKQEIFDRGYRLPKFAPVAIFIVIIAAIVFWRPLLSSWYANLGSVHHTRADLSPSLNDADRELMTSQAVSYFEQALNLNPSQPTANRRFGRLALEREVFDVAVIYLERALTQEPDNPATLELLGYAYLWNDQLDLAEETLRQVQNQRRVLNKLRASREEWQAQDREDLVTYAEQMVRRLSPAD